MYCQVCGAPNRDDHEFCVRCHQKLLVLSGSLREEEERLRGGLARRASRSTSTCSSASRSSRRRSSAPPRPSASSSAPCTSRRRTSSINQTGLSALRELLEQKKYIGWDEWSELWESKMDYQLLALEKRERFLAIKERIAALYHGDKRKLFLQHLEDAEYALFAFDIERAVGALEAAYKLDRGNYELAYFLGETHFNEANSEARADLLHPRPGGEAGPLRGAGLQRRHPLRARRPHPRRGVPEAGGRHLPRQLPAALQPRARSTPARGTSPRPCCSWSARCEVDPVPQALFLLGSCYYEMGKLSLGRRTSCRRRCGTIRPSRRPTTCSGSPISTATGRARRSTPSARRSGSTRRSSSTRTWCATSPATPARRCPRWTARPRSGSARARSSARATT